VHLQISGSDSVSAGRETHRTAGQEAGATNCGTEGGVTVVGRLAA